MTATPEGAAPPRGASQDEIDALAGIASGSPLAELRARRPEVVRHAQASHAVLLAPDDPGTVSLREREIVAVRVAALSESAPLVDAHSENLRLLGVDEETVAAATLGAGERLSRREAAMLQHAERLTLDPGSAQLKHVQALGSAGLSPRDVVTVSQLIALLSFQVRAVAALRALSEDA
ncbi:MAG: CMD domain protein [Chloroflexi bacterium]|nr:CMD domain protein [Chloroflexota bacterium]